ncbi:hypothetical protein M5K25_000713 [Dendrobium thyrsiflorum]|uniref:Uncharacterized protein n=1 Tax=Dendrobium thyrsiflorum TaxID=117978 RepID=A0ABD0VWP4_DENTH
MEAKASNSEAKKQPKQEGKKKQVGRNKVAPTLPKTAANFKQRRVMPHLGSNTDEDDVIPTKSKKISQTTVKGNKKAENSNFDCDYESIYMSKDDKSFSFLRKSLGSFLEVASDDE